MTAGGKPGKPNAGFPSFPPPLEIASRFPHSHSSDNYTLIQRSNNNHDDDLAAAIQRSVPVLVEMVENNDNLKRIAEVLPMFPV